MLNKTVTLLPPAVQGNRVVFSWRVENSSAPSSYWVEYPDLVSIDASPGKLAEAYFPVCIAFSLLGDVTIILPSRIHPPVLSRWQEAIERIGEKLCRKPPRVTLEQGPLEPDYKKETGNRTGLFFGGGTESLLTLAHLRDSGIQPLLISLGGSRWAGSDPEHNSIKFEMDRRIADEMKLERLSVRTNFREVFTNKAWKPRTVPDASFMNAALALPSFLSFVFPVCEQLGIGALANGNELMNFPDEYYCFSPEATSLFDTAAYGVRYRSHLGNMLKEDVCFELYRRYPQYAKYQYSCWRNQQQRWCYACQSCLQYYMLIRNSGLPAETIGIRESMIRAHLKPLIWAAAQSAEARPSEIWERMYLYPRLRKDPFLSQILRRVRSRSVIYRYYRPTPKWFKAPYRLMRFCVRALARWTLSGGRWLERLRLDCWLIDGKERTSGARLSFAYAGVERHKNYFVKTACSEARERRLGRKWIWNVSGAIHKRMPDCSFAVFEASGIKESWLRMRSTFRLPVWVKSEIPLPADAETIQKNPIFAEMRRRIRKYHLTWRVSRELADFEHFYWDMYVAYIEQTHGNAAYIEEYAALRKKFLQGELLLLIDENQQTIAAQLIHYRKDAGHLVCIGILEGKEEYQRMGVAGVLVYFSALRVQERGYQTVDFGYCRSFLNDGVYQFKTRLGARMTGEHHSPSGHLLLRFFNLTDSLKAFLLAHPFLAFIDQAYRAVVFLDKWNTADGRTHVRSHSYQGLPGLRFYSFEECEERFWSEDNGEGKMDVRILEAASLFDASPGLTPLSDTSPSQPAGISVPS